MFQGDGAVGDNEVRVDGYRLKLLAVALRESDGCNRFVRSAKVFGHDLEMVGSEYDPDNAGKELGGYQISLLRDRLEIFLYESFLWVDLRFIWKTWDFLILFLFSSFHFI